MTAPNLTVIEQELHKIYGKGSMVTACAKGIHDRWEGWETDSDPDRDLPYRLNMLIWNWFAGGGTAEIAANRVLEAAGYKGYEQ